VSIRFFSVGSSIGLVLVVSGLLAGPPPAAAAEAEAPTRLERLRQERLRRQQHVRPNRQGLLEHQLVKLEKSERPSIFDINFKGFYPTIAGISSGSRLAPGVRFWRSEIGGSPVSVHASAAYSFAHYELYDLQVGRIPHRPGKLPARSTKGDDVYELASGRANLAGPILYASLRYRHNPQERFYGLGPDSIAEDQTSFLLQDMSYELVGGWQFNPHVVATLRAGYVQASVDRGTEKGVPATQDIFGDVSAPGLLRQPDFMKGTAQLLLDYRDHPFNPHRGGLVALSLSRVDDRGGDEFKFTRFAADARGYLPLGAPERVLALRLYTSLDDAAGDSRVPFYMQETLGSSRLLRGFPTFRFRGEKLLSLQAEYRWEAIPALELAVFVDSGKVFTDIGDWGLSGLETSYGAGLRLKSSSATLVRFDVARSPEDTRLYLKFGAAF
jgi:hypothetical protein